MGNALILLMRINCCNHFGKILVIPSTDEDEHVQQNQVCVSTLPTETLK